MNKDLARSRFDYYSALGDFGVSHADAWEQSCASGDFSGEAIEGIEVLPSPIHGNGLFASRSFSPGEKICLGRVGEVRTIAGRYCNHHHKANSVFSWDGENISLVCVSQIQPGDEITVNYRTSLSLQINEPEKCSDLVASNTSLAKMERCQMSGVYAIAYDLLMNPEHCSMLSYNERVYAFESYLEELPGCEIETEHEFINGLYRRQITFSPGVVATGKIHTADHMDVVLYGEMIVATDSGFEHIVGPCCRTSRAGKKKAGLALTECRWVTYHPTQSVTVEDAEKEIFAQEEGFLDCEAL